MSCLDNEGRFEYTAKSNTASGNREARSTRIGIFLQRNQVRAQPLDGRGATSRKAGVVTLNPTTNTKGICLRVVVEKTLTTTTPTTTTTTQQLVPSLPSLRQPKTSAEACVVRK